MRRTVAAWKTAALWLAAFAAAAAFAAPVENHERIRAVVEAHALAAAGSFAPDGARVAVEVARLDPRLALPACPLEPEAFDPPGQSPSARLSVGVRCPVPPAWSLYVPVRVEAIVDVLVLAAPVAAGDTLHAADLRFEPRDVSRLNGAYFTRVEQAEGMVLRGPVRPGTVLTARQVELRKIVRRGQRVDVVARFGGLAVRSEGEALADAAEGDRVRVRNSSSQLVVEGIVDAEGRVHTGG